MNTKRTIGVCLSLLGLILGARGETKEKSMTLEECIITALKNNLAVAVEVLNPELADIAVTRTKERFIPRLSFSYGRDSQNSASYSYIDAAMTVTTASNSTQALLTQLFPTGGELQVLLYSYKTDSNRNFQTINPRFGSTLQFSFSQPLLRNFGFLATRREIIVARNTRDMSEAQLRAALQNAVYQTEEAYWNLVYSVQDLAVKKTSLELAQDLLMKTKREAEVGRVAEIEILGAEAEAASRQADILQVEAAVRNNENILKTLVNLKSEDGQLIKIVPAEKPRVEKKEITYEEAVQTAIARRPDLEASRIDLKTREVNYSFAKNQLLPDIRVEASYWSPGLSGTQIMYLNNDPFTGVIIGTVPSGASAALRDALKFKYRNWSVGLTLNLPTDSIFSHALYSQAKVEMAQARLRLKNQEQQALLEIENAVNAIGTDYKRVQAYQAAREMAEKKLAGEEKKLQVGMSTNFIVLQYQRDLANARSAELRALIDYNLSLAKLDRALGTGLESKNIRISEVMRQEE